MSATANVAVILAAGQGKRMRSALPKVLHPVAGRPMVVRICDVAAAVDARPVVVVGPDSGDVRRAVAEAVPNVAFAEQTVPRGTGDAVRAALPELANARRVLVLCGDVPLLSASTVERLVEATPEDELGMVTVTVDDPSGLGRILRGDDGAVAGIVEERDASAEQRAIREINAGIYCLPGSRVAEWLGALSDDNAQGEYYLTDVVAFAVAEDVAVHTVAPADPAEVLGVNDRVQLARIERLAQRAVAERLMREGTTVADPDRIDVRGELVTGGDCFVDVGCVFAGRVELGAGVRVGPHCVLRDCTVADGAVLEAFSHVDGAAIGEDNRIGPFARLREGTRLAAGVRIGNFVETKKAVLGPRSKANHLAYLGDATLGADCNVGAGTITCNYDGVAKHPTIAGDNVFFGSNSTLVAPVEFGSGAYVGAGSTVTKDVPGGALAVGRGRQRIIEDWTPPKERTAED